MGKSKYKHASKFQLIQAIRELEGKNATLETENYKLQERVKTLQTALAKVQEGAPR